jgi:glucosamine kinase
VPRADTSATPATCLIGVDGGGTSCRVALICAGQRFEVTLGGANVATDRAGALATVHKGIEQVADMAELDAAQVQGFAAHVGLAGIYDQADERAVAGDLALANVTVSDDQLTNLVGAFGDGDGVLAGIGTGSFLARQAAGKRRFAGGWGLVLGDEASGAWLGRGALAASLHALDRQIEHTGLSRALLARFGAGPGIMGFVRDARPGDLAALAPDVVAAADQGDALARRLLRAGGDYIDRGLRALGWSPGEAVCLTGGLGMVYEPFLGADLRQCIREPLGSALDGALMLAARIGVDK